MKIMISGGHLTPALALIDYVLSLDPKNKNEIIFVGRVYSQDKLKQKALEKQEIQKRIKKFPDAKIKFVPFTASRFANNSFIEKIKNSLSLFISLISAIKIIKKQKPDVFLSFGGYLAVSITIASWLKKIPVITHEQTRTIGMANKIISKFASKIAISYESSRGGVPLGKVVFTGNPVRAGVLNSSSRRPEWLPGRLAKPLLLIMGGNQGSRVLNEVVAKSLEKLLSEWIVIHQCGKPTSENNYLEQLNTKKENIDKLIRNNYFIKEWVSEQDLSWIYRKAFGAISRAGANATQELALVALPTIFIPLPFAYKNEQLLNAKWLVSEGGAVLLEQSKFSKNNLLDALDQIKQFNEMMRKNLRRLNLEKRADKKLYDLLLEVVNGKK